MKSNDVVFNQKSGQELMTTLADIQNGWKACSARRKFEYA
jgi:hypothetical protein